MPHLQNIGDGVGSAGVAGFFVLQQQLHLSPQPQWHFTETELVLMVD